MSDFLAPLPDFGNPPHFGEKYDREGREGARRNAKKREEILFDFLRVPSRFFAYFASLGCFRVPKIQRKKMRPTRGRRRALQGEGRTDRKVGRALLAKA